MWEWNHPNSIFEGSGSGESKVARLETFNLFVKNQILQM